MTATGHALTGALVATVVKQPLLAIPLAFLSHFVCDALPHLGFEDFSFGSKILQRWLIVDGIVVALVLASIVLFIASPLLVVVCACVAMSPDVMWLYHGLRGNTEDKHGSLATFHGAIQKYEEPIGVVVDIVWSLAMIVGIVKLQ